MNIKNTAKNTAIYGFGSMIRRITGFIMLPIYTRYLTPEDYGVVELLMIAIEFAGILVGLRITQALLRYTILADTILEKKQIVSTILLVVIAASAIGYVFIYLFAPDLSHVIFGSDRYIFELKLFALTLITNAVSAVGMGFLRSRQQAVMFLTLNIASLVLQVVLNIIFIIILEMHVLGIIYSSIISGAVLALYLSFYVFINVGLNFCYEIYVKLLKFTAPLVLASLGAFFATYIDKYFLRIFHGLSDVGLYALATRVAGILAMVFEAFNMAWAADRFEIIKRSDANVIFDKIFRIFSSIMIAACVGLCVFTYDFFKIMTTPHYYEAANIVSILVLAGYVMFNTYFNNFGIIYKEQTRHIAKATWLKAIIRTILCFVLIPKYGIYGAAIAYLISNVAEFIAIYIYSTTLYDMELNWKPILLVFGIAIVTVIICDMLPRDGVEWFSLRGAAFVAFCGLIYYLPIFDKADKEFARQKIGEIISKLRGA